MQLTKHVGGLVTGLALLLVGCGPGDSGKAAKPTPKKDSKHESGHNYKGRDWCQEHEMPESICFLCGNGPKAEVYKGKGDWCAEHELPKSQCFQCDPKLKEKYAQDYREKYGEDPPPMEEDEKKK